MASSEVFVFKDRVEEITAYLIQRPPAVALCFVIQLAEYLFLAAPLNPLKVMISKSGMEL